MARDQFKRKPTTILSANVAGYSRLMGEDEAATVNYGGGLNSEHGSSGE